MEKSLLEIEKKFSPKNEYNRYLFELYLRYIRRYRLNYFHKKQAQGLLKIIEREAVVFIQSWEKILELSHEYRLFHGNKKNNGCAFLKIGYMLQELGVIGLRRDDRSFWVKRSISKLPSVIQGDVSTYLKRIERLGKAETTAEKHLRYIRDLTMWLEQVYPQLSIYEITESKCVEYSEALIKRSDNVHFLRDNIQGIGNFYEWLKYNRKVKQNPCDHLLFGKPQAKINICSDEQLKGLARFIKADSSEPEGAFLISLILFFGLTTEELIKARLDSSEDDLKIIFSRPPRTYGRRYYNRDETLALPKTPSWFLALQRRFLASWQGHFDLTKNSFQCSRLVLPKHHHYTRPLGEKALLTRICDATLEATGSYIHPKVLRQTCGHMYSQNGDGSILSMLGWSREFAFCYTWLPRKIVSETKLPKFFEKPQP